MPIKNLMKLSAHACHKALINGMLFAACALSADRPLPVSPIQLIINPAKYDKRLVMVTGYLWISEPHGISPLILYPHREDFENQLPYGIPIGSSKLLLDHRADLNRMYVVLIGTFHYRPGPGPDPTWEDGGTFGLGEIVSCILWSDPRDPVALKKHPEFGDQMPRK